MIKPIEFTVENFSLRGNFYIPDGEKNPPGVILFHGSGSKGLSLAVLAEKLMNNGIFAFFFNFRGCGESDGNYYEQTIADGLKDARTAFDFFLGQDVNHDRIGVVGSSFGGEIASLIFKEYPIKSMIFRSPSASDRPTSSTIDQGSEEDEHNYYFVHSEKWESSQSLENIAEFEGSLLLIESSNDNNVPENLVQKYFDSATSSKNKKIEVIKGADHRLSKQEWIDEFVDISLDWFLETL